MDSLQNVPYCHCSMKKKTTIPAMVENGMDVLKQAVEFLNPGQIPVTVFNQFHFHL